jgi:hypothetical protein
MFPATGHGGNNIRYYLFLSYAAQKVFPVTRIERASVADTDSGQPPAEAAPSSGAWSDSHSFKPSAGLRRLDDYIRRDETSLLRQRAILAECEGPARAIAEATVAEYEQALAALYRRRARLLAKA